MEEKPAVYLKMIELYVDGSCEPRNPGGNGVAGAVLYANGLTDGRTRQLGAHPRMSNNVAEYEGLHLGLEICLERNIDRDFVIYSDSMLVVNQMTGRWQAKPDKLYTEAFKKTRAFYHTHFQVKTIQIKWISGAENPADIYTRPYLLEDDLDDQLDYAINK